MYDLIVIGAGPGGYEAAAHAGRMGKKAAVVEKGYLGGTCLNRGCIPTKTLLRTSKLLADCKNAERYGIRVAQPLLDFAALKKRKDSVIGTLRKGVDTLLQRSGVDLIEGHATLVSNKAVQVEEENRAPGAQAARVRRYERGGAGGEGRRSGRENRAVPHPGAGHSGSGRT